ncbi:MAG: ChuX/HutX family heme-like substrate-binding protein [Myxococcota bacterium]
MTLLAELSKRWAELAEREPKLRIRDAAEKLGVSEGQLLATKIGDTVVPLKVDDWVALLSDCRALGEVMALTRNEHVVIEKHGLYQNVEGSERMGMVLDEGIDLRLFFHRWRHAFAVESDSRKGRLRSLQFFDGAGEAIHKIYVFENGEVQAFNALVSRYRGETAPEFEPATELAPVEERPDSEIDVAALRKAWSALDNTHDFYPMLNQQGVSRLQAMRLAGDDFAYPVAADAYAELIRRLASEEIPFMAFVGNPGCIQIHSGQAKKIVDLENWFNIFDPDFNLHVRTDGMDQSWAVRKPTAQHGDIWSLESFDPAKQNVLSLFGVRKRDHADSPRWMADFERVLKEIGRE